MPIASGERWDAGEASVARCSTATCGRKNQPLTCAGTAWPDLVPPAAPAAADIGVTPHLFRLKRSVKAHGRTGEWNAPGIARRRAPDRGPAGFLGRHVSA